MRSRGPSTKLIATTAAALFTAITLGGCNDRAGDELTTPSDAGVPTRTATDTDPPTVSASSDRSSEKARIRAARDAGEPAKGLIWRVPTKPPTWTKLQKQEDGLQRWYVKPGCYVRLWQLDGAAGDDPLSMREILKLTAKQNSSLFPGKPKPVYRSSSTIKLNAFVAGIDDVGLAKMATSIVDHGKARSQVIAYRDGDLALTYTSYCSTAKAFEKVSASDFDEWRANLAEETTY